MTTLPPRFLLHIISRSTKVDPFAGYVLVDSVHENGAWKLNVVPAGSPTILVGPQNHAYSSRELLRFCYPSHPPTSTPILLWVKHIATVAQLESAGTPVPVYTIAAAPSCILPPRQKRNVHIKPLPGTPIGPQSEWIDTTNGPHAAGYIQHVTHTPTPVPTPPTAITIHPYVARQLLELAQLKHEMCPITAEEYITGETGVMPCGHLFMRMAIEETFKTEPNKCPACRQTGVPQFV